MNGSSKFKRIEYLAELGLNVPRSISVSRDDFKVKISDLANSKTKYIVRSPSLEWKKRKYEPIEIGQLFSYLEFAFSKYKSIFEFTITEIISSKISGALYYSNNSIYIEYVAGIPKQLLVEGDSPKKLLVGANGQIISDFETSPENEDDDEQELINKIVNCINVRSGKLQDGSLFEWVLDRDSKPYFFDFKLLDTEFLKKFILESSNSFSCLATLDYPLHGKLAHAIESIKPNDILVLDNLIFDKHSIIISNVSAIISKSGGLLSHLSVYSFMENIPVIISPTLYDRSKKCSYLNIDSVFSS